jgi:hypothetical protein
MEVTTLFVICRFRRSSCIMWEFFTTDVPTG